MANRKVSEQKKAILEFKPFTEEEKTKLIELRSKWDDEDDRNHNRIDK